MDRHTLEKVQQLNALVGRLNALFPKDQLETIGRMQRKFAPVFEHLARLYGSAAPEQTSSQVVLAPKELPIKPAWNPEIDANIPAPFKALYRRMLALEFPRLTPLEYCAFLEYLRLAKSYYEKGLGVVSQETLWDNVGDVWEEKTGSRPSQRSRLRVLEKIGLDLLPPPARGRRPSEY